MEGAARPLSPPRPPDPVSEDRFSLKDHLFNEEKVSYLGSLLSTGVPGFDRERFETAVMAQIPDLELKQRIALIARVLHDHLDPDFAVAADQIRSALPPPLDPTKTDDDFGDFIIAPFGRYVEDHGMNHYEASLALLKDITKRFSMEGSVRPFINAEPQRTLDVFHTWARDDNYHVRRLVSESTRPRLPWAPRIEIDVAAPIPLLDVLHADDTRYVTRSVANHLNDISKIDPPLVFEALHRWRGETRQAKEELDWMTGHSLRTLLKDGDPTAMEILGYSPEPDIVARFTEITPDVYAGEALEFAVEVTARSDERLMIDYSVDFVKKGGETRAKVFKLKRLVLPEGETLTLGKRHPLRSDATTYTLYPGKHLVTILANGKPVAHSEFELIVE